MQQLEEASFRDNLNAVAVAAPDAATAAAAPTAAHSLNPTHPAAPSPSHVCLLPLLPSHRRSKPSRRHEVDNEEVQQLEEASFRDNLRARLYWLTNVVGFLGLFVQVGGAGVLLSGCEPSRLIAGESMSEYAVHSQRIIISRCCSF